jgi:hypothetical protein
MRETTAPELAPTTLEDRPMKTFLILDRVTGARTLPVEYRPLKVTVGDTEHTLALHQSAGYWRVSDPVCGGGICSVNGLYKGVPVSSKGMGVREATAAARESVASLVSRNGGPAEWNARLAAARRLYADVIPA